jgi:hypothetical protein
MQAAYAILSSVACSTLYIFPRYLINGKIFGGKIIEQEMRVFILSTNFV